MPVCRQGWAELDHSGRIKRLEAAVDLLEERFRERGALLKWASPFPNLSGSAPCRGIEQHSRGNSH